MTVLIVGFTALALGVAAGRRGALDHSGVETGEGMVGLLMVLAAVVFVVLFVVFTWVDYEIGFDNYLTQLFASAGEFNTNLPYCGGTTDMASNSGYDLILVIEAFFALFMLFGTSWFIIVLPPLGALCGFIGAFRWILTGKSGLLRFGGWLLGIGGSLIIIWYAWIRLCIIFQQYPWGCKGAV